MKVRAFLVMPLLLISAFATADCVVPYPIPDLPNGARASRATMVSAHSRVWHYVKEAEQYLACLDRDSGTGASEYRIQAYNATVSVMRDLVARLQKEVARFNGER